jgi:flagellar biosynthesis/type III secretory pathway M-ring protein FliF/YscJ
LSLQQILDAVSSLGTLGFALLTVYAFLKELVVPRSRLDEQRADKKEAMDLARQAIAANERLADAVETRNQLEAARDEAERKVRGR